MAKKASKTFMEEYKTSDTFKTSSGLVITLDEAKALRRKFLDEKKNGYKHSEEQELLQTEIILWQRSIKLFKVAANLLAQKQK